MAENNNRPGPFASILAISTLIAGIVAIVRPIQGELAAVRHAIERHQDLSGHTGVLAELAAMREASKEVETQFQALKEYYNQRLAWKHDEIVRMRDWQAEHDRRVIKEYYQGGGE